MGGYAVITHGFPRTTANLDILVRPTLANAQCILRALARYGYVDGEFEAVDFTTTPNFLSFSSNGIWIDLMTQLLGVIFEECLTDSLQLQFADVPVRYIGLAALRAAKRASGRPQDLRDLDNLPENF